MIWWDLHVWWQWVDRRQGLARGTPWDHPAKTHLAGSHLPESKLICCQQHLRCKHVQTSIKHYSIRKIHGSPHPMFAFFFFTDFISFLFFSWSKDPLSPPHTPKHQATIKPSSIPKKNLQNHTSFHSPPKKVFPPPRNPTCQWRTTIFIRRYILHGCISIVILVFRSVHVLKD